MINEIEENPRSKYKVFMDKVVKERQMAKGLESNPADSHIGLSPLIARRRQLYGEQGGTEKFTDNNLKDKPEQDKVQAEESPHSPVVKVDSGDASLEKMAEIGADGQFIKEDKPSTEVDKFEPPVAEKVPEEAKPGTVDATDNAERAEQAVKRPKIKTEIEKPPQVEVPPQVNIGVERSIKDASDNAEPPVVTIDEVISAHKDEISQAPQETTIDHDLETATVNPTAAETPGIASPMPDVEETVKPENTTPEKEVEEQVPITVNGAVQPAGEYFDSSGQNVSGQGGLKRIQEIQRGINPNLDEVNSKQPEIDKLDEEVDRVRKEALEEDGINPAEPITVQEKPAEPEPEVINESQPAEDEGIHRITVNELPDKNPFERAKAYANEKDLTADKLAKLRPGGNTYQAKSDEEQLPMAA